MAAILLRPNNQYYIIDVVKKITRSMPVDITSNPVETGESISDHLVLQNKTWVLEGVVSDATFAWWDEVTLENKVIGDVTVKTEKSGSGGVSTSVSVSPNPDTNSTFVKTNRPGVGTGSGATSLTSRLKSFAGAQLGFITQFIKAPIKVNVSQSGVTGEPGDVTVTQTGTAQTIKPAVVTYQEVEKPSAYDKYRLLEEMRDNKEILILTHSTGQFTNLVIKDVTLDRDSTISKRSFVFTLTLEQIQVIDKAKTVAIAKLPKAAPKPNAAAADACSLKVEAGAQTKIPSGTSTDPNSQVSSSVDKSFAYVWSNGT